MRGGGVSSVTKVEGFLVFTPGLPALPSHIPVPARAAEGQSMKQQANSMNREQMKASLPGSFLRENATRPHKTV